ncbi:Yeast KU70 protein homologue, putative [Candida dubliniensis CD36]|uniref:DNA helicase n=1 Tax=Candida dubliniensis (strain CD36 / ATCC MYA-646 / CBS 7987 / NCPF 3949 / NRRL Y-17841) TaxID=573826 RepID=B9W9I0_CANDC|nr:Yeast KU70 protein homologue, putative [Candida dubliniensis CD36]CAX45463.1 Yeast KU70 protein homologue, putative [Candida dubliniensis CD36]
MSWHNQSNDPNNDDEYGNKKFKQYEIKEGIAFLIEITPELLTPQLNLNSHSQLFEILSSINDLMQELIITSRSTGIGIYFYNCDKSNKLSSMKNINCIGFERLFHLNVLNLANMKKLNDLIQDDINNIKSIDEIFKYQPLKKIDMKLGKKQSQSETQPQTQSQSQSSGSIQETQLTVVLNKMIDEFINKKEFNKRRMVWITTNDKPYHEESEREALWRTIDDFYYYGFFIEPLFLSTNGQKPFDFELYKDIFMNTNYLKKSQENSENLTRTVYDNDDDQNNDDDENLIKPSGGFSKDSVVFKKSVVGDQIRKTIFRIKEVRRIQFTCDLILSDNGKVGGGFGCTIKGYMLYSHEKINRNELLLYTRSETLKKVFVSTKLMQNGKIIEIAKDSNKSYQDRKEEAGIKKGYEIGGGQDIVILNKQQLEFLTNYSFDHRLKDSDDHHDGEDGNDSLETDISDDDDDDEKVGMTGGETKPVLFSKAPYLKLIGFRDISHFNPVYSCGAPIFVTPDIDNGMTSSAVTGGFTNSFKTFASLYRSCVKLNQYAIVFGCTRSNSRPYLYALYPTQTTNSSKIPFSKKLDDSDDDDDDNDNDNVDKNQDEFPQGFLLIKLPWLEDVRALPREYITNTQREAIHNDDSLIESFKQLLPKFELSHYDPREFPNASLNYFYKVIKHEILQMEFKLSQKPLIENDITMQKLVQLKNSINNDDTAIELLQKINSRMDEIDSTIGVEVLKRKQMEIDNQTDKKKEKKFKSGPISDQEILHAWENNQLDRFSMDQLKEFKRKYPEVKSANRKAELIENISQFINTHKR